jgi:hypothetical protein
MYQLVYDLLGKASTIKRLSDGAFIPIANDNSDYQDFLKWNSTQKKPLDLKSTIEPVKPGTARDLATEIDSLKSDIEKLKTK